MVNKKTLYTAAAVCIISAILIGAFELYTYTNMSTSTTQQTSLITSNVLTEPRASTLISEEQKQEASSDTNINLDNNDAVSSLKDALKQPEYANALERFTSIKGPNETDMILDDDNEPFTGVSSSKAKPIASKYIIGSVEDHTYNAALLLFTTPDDAENYAKDIVSHENIGYIAKSHNNIVITFWSYDLKEKDVKAMAKTYWGIFN